MAANQSPAANDIIATLDAAIDQLLNLLDSGDWDHLPDLETSLLPALAAVRQSPSLASRNWNLAKLTALQQKLGKAVHECEARKSQIAPLLTALDRIQRKTPSA